MPALPHQVAASRFSVLTPCTYDDDAQLQMVLQVLAHAGSGATDIDAGLAQARRLAHAGQFQQLGRIDTGGQHHLAPRAHGLIAAVARAG